MHADDTKALVRHASSRRLLSHLPGDLVSHSAASKAILTIPPLSGVLSIASLISKSLNSVVEVMEEWPGSQNLQRAPYSLAHNTSLSFFDHIAAQPDRARYFADSMSFLMNSPALSSEYVEALIPALDIGSRIVIMDAIVPEPGTLGKLGERRITASDVVMKALFNARERTQGEWRSLIQQVDPKGKLKVAEVLQPKGSQMGFVVVERIG